MCEETDEGEGYSNQVLTPVMKPYASKRDIEAKKSFLAGHR